MYQALYRKWRPQTFDQVVGQGHITETLKNQVRSGRLSHAYIFIGTRGTGKTTCARILAKAVNCHAPVDGNPCGKCPACQGMEDGSVLDVVEIDAASNSGVDNMRALREEAVFSPASVKKRVYIIDEVHMLSNAAFNALLKILEEPPEHLIFILATTELYKVPATILSRCQRHSFHRLSSEQIAEYLLQVAEKENFSLTADAAALIARLAEGGVRDALSLLDQCSAHEHIDSEAVYSVMGLAGKRRIAKMLEYILAHDTASALTDFSAMWMEGKDPTAFLKELGGLVRDVMMMRTAPGKCGALLSGSYDDKTLKAFAARLEAAQLIAMMETVQGYQAQLREAVSPKTEVELCLISLCDDTVGESVNALRGRIAKLEARLASGAFQAAARPAPSELSPEAEKVPALSVEPQPEEEDDLPWLEEPEAYDEPRPVYEDEAEPAPYFEEPLPEYDEEPERISEAEPEVPAQPAASAPAMADWKTICTKAAAKLPVALKSQLTNELCVSGRIENGVLNIQVDDAFTFGRLNRPAVQEALAATASELCGCEIRVKMQQGEKAAAVQRSLDDLKAFPGISFTGE